MRKSILIFAVAAFCAFLSLSAFAANIDYSGELDRQSGKPASSAESSESKNGDRVSIGNNVYYNSAKKMYYYGIGQGEVAISVPSGTITTSSVYLAFPEGITGQVYQDGVLMSDNREGELTEPGNYVILFGGDTASEKSLKFSIVKKTTGAINGYRIPDGFTVTEAKLDDQPMDCSGYVDMTAEGFYNIVIRCRKTGVTHSLAVRIDHTAPTLKLEAVKNGHAKGPVDISDWEAGSSVTVFRNGKETSFTDTLTKTGDYQVEISDEAGNKTSYEFHIDVYFNFSGILFLVLAAGGVAALLVYLRLKSKRLRIR